MSRVRTDTECKSHSVNVTGANCQCHGCIQILCVNHTQSMSRVHISQCPGCTIGCVDTGLMSALYGFGQCHECISILKVYHTQSMSRMQIVNVTGADTQLGGELYRNGQCHGCRLVNVTGAHRY